MPFSILDLVVLGVVVISALLAAVRGFTREVLAIVAWVAAAAVAWYLHPAVLPMAQQYIHNGTIALVASIGAVFVITLIIVSIITVQISDMILDSRIGALDRTLGLFFGAARGFLICVIGWAFMGWLLQGKNPEWAATSKARPAMENTRDNIVAMLPENAEALIQRLREKGVNRETEPAEPAEPDPQRTAPPANAPAAGAPPARAPSPGAPAGSTAPRPGQPAQPRG